MTHPIRRGLTLIELIIIIGLLLILAALVLPAIARLRGAAERSSSTNNLRQVGLAAHNYLSTFNKWPPALGKANNAEGPAHFHMLPFIEQDQVFRVAEGAPWKKGVYGTVIRVYIDPSDTTAPPGNLYQGWLATTSYASNWRAFGAGDKSIADIQDGTSNTLMFTTRYQMCNGNPTGWGYPSLYYWAPIVAHYTSAKFQISPKQEECDPALPQTIGAALLIGLCDGSVRTIDPGISPQTWRLLCEPSDGMPLANDFN